MAEIAPGCDGAGMVRPERPDPGGQNPLKPPNGPNPPPGRQVLICKGLPGPQGIRVARPKDAVADRGKPLPVRDGSCRQTRVVQAPPCTEQQRVTTTRPQQVSSGLLKAGRARPDRKSVV